MCSKHASHSELNGQHNWRDLCITSRKHGKKEPQSFSHCGSFDHPDPQLINDCRFFFWFYNCNFENLGASNTPLERYF
jgi:hypothetical protein